MEAVWSPGNGPAIVASAPERQTKARASHGVCRPDHRHGRLPVGSEPETEDQVRIRNPKSLVSLGDKFALASGLMEITYDTGAKVILQGPVHV